MHFLDGEQIEGDSDALSLEKIGFPLRVSSEGNSRNVYVSVAAIKYVAINPVAGDRVERDPRVGMNLPKAVLHFVDGDTISTYKDEYFGQQSEGYNARLWDPKARALLRVMVSMYALKGVFFVDSFDSRTDADKREHGTRPRRTRAQEVPIDWIQEERAPDVDPELRSLARNYQRRLALERDLELGTDPVRFENAIRKGLDHLLEEDLVALRPERDGRITGYRGIAEMQQQYGPWVLDAHLPDPGTPTQPVEAGYMANAWVRMVHADYDQLRAMLDTVGRSVRVEAA